MDKRLLDNIFTDKIPQYLLYNFEIVKEIFKFRKGKGSPKQLVLHLFYFVDPVYRIDTN